MVRINSMQMRWSFLSDFKDSINSIDLSYVKMNNNDLGSAFDGCHNLTRVVNINEGIIDMDYTFRSCSNLVNAPVIPNSVINMHDTFCGCTNLVNAPVIPNSVIDMSGTFIYCKNLENVSTISSSVVNLSNTFRECPKLKNVPSLPNTVIYMEQTFYNCFSLRNAPVIPKLVTDMSYTFGRCNSLRNAPAIPNSVINMQGTFFVCSNLVNAPVIPNSVTEMDRTFSSCSNLVNAPVIPNSVTNIDRTFQGCSNLTGDILICSNQITNASDCFINTSLNKNAYIPFTYQNGDNTLTYNSFINAGYSTTNRKDGVLLKDINNPPISINWEYINNSRLITLTKYKGVNSIVIVPTNVEDSNDVYIHNESLKNNQTIVNVDLSNVPWVDNQMNSSFLMCNNLYSVSNINNNVESLTSAFSGCHNLVNAPIIPNSVKYCHSVFRNCHNLVNAPEIPESATVLTSAFHDCKNLTGDIIIHSENVSGAFNCFYGSNKDKNVYIPFYYENGVRTRTYNSFRSAHYETGIGTINRAFLKDLATYQP